MTNVCSDSRKGNLKTADLFCKMSGGNELSKATISDLLHASGIKEPGEGGPKLQERHKKRPNYRKDTKKGGKKKAEMIQHSGSTLYPV